MKFSRYYNGAFDPNIMITVASFLYAAYLICDDTISESATDRTVPYTLCTSEHFHKVFLNAGGYFLEFDTKADMHYDASGLGRVHKEDAPSAICLSVPGCVAPNYALDLDESVNFSLCSGCMENSEPLFASDTQSSYDLTESAHSDTKARATFQVTLPNAKKISTDYTVDAFGVQINVIGEGEVVHMLPAFFYDGENATVIEAGSNQLTITYKGFCCRYITDGEIVDAGKMGGNRNGHYQIFYAKKTNTLSVTIEIFEVRK